MDYKTRLFLRVVPGAWDELVAFVIARMAAKSGRIGLKSCVERMRDEVRLLRVTGVNVKFMISNSHTAYLARLMLRHIPALKSRVITGTTQLDPQVQLDVTNRVLHTV